MRCLFTKYEPYFITIVIAIINKKVALSSDKCSATLYISFIVKI